MEIFLLILFCYLWNLFFSDSKSSNKSSNNNSNNSQANHLSSQSYTYMEEIGIKLAMSLAMADGKLKKSEAKTINLYMKNTIDKDFYLDTDHLKECLNNSLVEAKSLSEQNKLKTIELCKTASGFDHYEQFDVLKLCLDVMIADGKAEKEELIQIDKIADKIGIEDGNLNKDYISMRDRALISLKPASVTRGDTLNEKLGIKKSWTKHKKLKFIIESFAKWNARMTVVKTDKERKNIQNILNLLSDAHELYK